MESPEKNKVALVSKKQAEVYFKKKNFGRAFAHILLALKLCTDWKNDLKSLFTTALCNWGEELESENRFCDLFNCYEQAIEIFPENEEVISNLGAHLLRLGHIDESSYYFKKALKIKSDYLPAYRNLQTISNLLVERWHFCMLNDVHRNEAYREAIFKKIQQGFNYVLDIGTGSGLLSFFAVDSGTRDVFACDYSKTMIETAKQIAESNGMDDSIKFINKLSNDLVIPVDISRRVSLVVTETVDAGLFGEHLLQTLLHAWDQLLLPPLPPASLVPPVPCIICRDSELRQSTRRNGIVVPFGATLWFAAVECQEIAQKYCHLVDRKNSSKEIKFPFLLNAKLEEPYDSENLNMIVDGYKLLCEPVHCFYINFNDISMLQDYMNGKFDDCVYKVKCTEKGRLDSFVFWFDLYLDEDIKLSSSPLPTNKNLDTCCWDQAIFPCQNQFIVSPETIIDVKVKTKHGKLCVEVANIKNYLSSLSNDIEVVNVPQEVVRYLNNTTLVNLLDCCVNLMKSKTTVLDLSPFPVYGLNFLMSHLSDANSDIFLYIIKSTAEIEVIKRIAVANRINCNSICCIAESDLKNDKSIECKFDVIVTNLIESNGELKDTSISQLPVLKNLLKPDGTFLPESIYVWGQIINSKWLRRKAEVLNEGLVEKYNIANFINKHKATQHLDLCMAAVKHEKLSEEFEIGELSMDDLLEKNGCEFTCSVKVSVSGEAMAVVYWYKYKIVDNDENCGLFSTRDLFSHTNQVAFMFEPVHQVVKDDYIQFKGKYNNGGFMFSID